MRQFKWVAAWDTFKVFCYFMKHNLKRSHYCMRHRLECVINAWDICSDHRYVKDTLLGRKHIMYSVYRRHRTCCCCSGNIVQYYCSRHKLYRCCSRHSFGSISLHEVLLHLYTRRNYSTSLLDVITTPPHETLLTNLYTRRYYISTRGIIIATKITAKQWLFTFFFLSRDLHHKVSPWYSTARNKTAVQTLHVRNTADSVESLRLDKVRCKKSSIPSEKKILLISIFKYFFS